MNRGLDEQATRELRAAYDLFLAELDRLGYSANAKITYEKTIDRFIRWLEGRWEPLGPR